MSKERIIKKLQPHWSVLKQRTYSEEQFIDGLCAFARKIFPKEDPEKLRSIIIEGYLESKE